MCLTIAHHELGAADVLLDHAEGLLVLRPTLTPGEQVDAARRILDAAGVEQVGQGVTCRCGEPLNMPGCDGPTVRRFAARSFAATAAAGLIAAGVVGVNTTSAAADDVFEVPAWSETVDRLGLECHYGERSARCTSRALGPVHVSVVPAPLPGVTEYRLESAADTMYVCRFPTVEARDAWVADHTEDAEPIGERGALHEPIALLGHTGPMS